MATETPAACTRCGGARVLRVEAASSTWWLGAQRIGDVLGACQLNVCADCGQAQGMGQPVIAGRPGWKPKLIRGGRG